jgi:hypothetical protein
MMKNPAAGLLRLARFRADGLALFDASPTGLLNALAPWLAFAIVGALLALFEERPTDVLATLLASVVALLVPIVVSHALARAWQRESGWLRYAVAMTWCQWVFPPALLVASLAGGALIAAGLPAIVAEAVAAAALIGYALSLQYFIASRALDVGRGRAVLMVGAVNVALLVFAFGPSLLSPQAPA